MKLYNFRNMLENQDVKTITDAYRLVEARTKNDVVTLLDHENTLAQTDLQSFCDERAIKITRDAVRMTKELRRMQPQLAKATHQTSILTIFLFTKG